MTANKTARVRRARRARPPAAPKPWLAVVLAVDTARTSGWSVLTSGKQREFGEVDTLDRPAVERIVRWALRYAAHLEVPAVLVLETPWGGTVQTIASLGAARERWLAAWRGAGHSADRVVLVNPSTWRAAVLGRHWASAKRAHVRLYEQSVAGRFAGCEVTPDEAAALLIGRWAAQAAQVGRVIGTRAQRASQRAWLG